jgi:hypothetical protein
MKKLTTILALIAVLMLTVPAFAQAPQFAGVASKARKDVYVVIMAADPAIAYEGDISGLPATKPAKGTKINPNSARQEIPKVPEKRERQGAQGRWCPRRRQGL